MVEVEQQTQEVWGSGARPDVVLCPVGGGGLMSGVAIASKGYFGKQGVKVIGAEPAGEFVLRVCRSCRQADSECLSRCQRCPWFILRQGMATCGRPDPNRLRRASHRDG